MLQFYWLNYSYKCMHNQGNHITSKQYGDSCIKIMMQQPAINFINTCLTSAQEYIHYKMKYVKSNVNTNDIYTEYLLQKRLY